MESVEKANRIIEKRTKFFWRGFYYVSIETFPDNKKEFLKYGENTFSLETIKEEDFNRTMNLFKEEVEKFKSHE